MALELELSDTSIDTLETTEWSLAYFISLSLSASSFDVNNIETIEFLKIF